ncbi:hypothetical protein DH86_00000835, partial [Scytalidium sp. 3C]
FLSGGVSRGKLTEVFGPPGVGKTTLGEVNVSLANDERRMQLAANALGAGEKVVWVDGAHPISPPRLSSILESSKPVTTLSGEGGSLEPPNVPDLLDNFVHITTPTLAHLIALLCHSIPDLFTPSTSLLIIDSLCALVDSAFPKSVDSANVPKKPGGMTHHFIFSIICFPYLSSPSGYRLSGFGVHIT